MSGADEEITEVVIKRCVAGADVAFLSVISQLPVYGAGCVWKDAHPGNHWRKIARIGEKGNAGKINRRAEHIARTGHQRTAKRPVEIVFFSNLPIGDLSRISFGAILQRLAFQQFALLLTSYRVVSSPPF